MEVQANFHGLFGSHGRNDWGWRNGAGGTADGMDRSKKTISLAGNGFDKARIFRIVLKRSAEFLQSGVEAAIKINVSPFGPERLPKLLAGDDLAGPLQKQSQDAEGLFLDFEAHALAGKYPLEQIDLIEAEPEGKFGVNTVFHEGVSPLK
jgi:hypothetical protein